MSGFVDFVSTLPAGENGGALVAAASECLDRFTACFNACNTAGMDGQLHFPHVMLSGASRLEWRHPGQHPADLFDQLRASGWHHTRYESKQPVLVSQDKVHFVVSYSRCNAGDEALSQHTNLWIVTRVDGRWGISLRSY